ncbi:NAD(+) diphosphatase [Williamsia sterculiae]|uniref:NAD(+) diphosphatase n=1 Tax=Williamsia sterculiae TaxID=1344003 RepID=A0A1N7FYA6_9NOCA|nr:NAD(+) diphosphatase [Williamsia sterculiae]SIS05226.1 NAD+ diphosphatase [Williamsia sterculiae]
MTAFELDLPPLLSRSTVDRADEIRDDTDRLIAGWPTARLVTVDHQGRYPVGDDGPRWIPATELGGTPPAGAVLLGIRDGIDLWTLRVDEIEGEYSDLRGGGVLLDGDQAGLLGTAVAILNWHDAAGFSPVDGKPTAPERSGWVRRNTATGSLEFPRTDSAIITVVHDGGDRILLGRQASWPERWYSTLAGFVEPGESLEQCVIREVHEEVGIDVWSPRYLGSQPWPFPRSLMLGFEATADPDQPLAFLDGEIGDAIWFHRDEVLEALDRGDWTRPATTLSRNSATDTAGAPDARLRLPGSISIARAMVTAWAHNGS